MQAKREFSTNLIQRDVVNDAAVLMLTKSIGEIQCKRIDIPDRFAAHFSAMINLLNKDGEVLEQQIAHREVDISVLSQKHPIPEEQVFSDLASWVLFDLAHNDAWIAKMCLLWADEIAAHASGGVSSHKFDPSIWSDHLRDTYLDTTALANLSGTKLAGTLCGEPLTTGEKQTLDIIHRHRRRTPNDRT